MLRNDALHATRFFCHHPRQGRAAIGRRPEGLPSGERQKKSLGWELAHAPRGFLAFVLPRRLFAKKRYSGTLLEYHAHPVPQPRVQGIQSPGGWVREARSLPGAPWRRDRAALMQCLLLGRLARVEVEQPVLLHVVLGQEVDVFLAQLPDGDAVAGNEGA